MGLLAKPLNGLILRQLSDGPKSLIHLRRECGSPAQTTLRAHLRELESSGVVARHKRNPFPGTVEYELQRGGAELLSVVATIERWLQQAPEGPLEFASGPAKAAIKALADGWSSTMLRALAAGPLSLTELDRIISNISYPSLERRLAAMRLAGHVRPCPGEGKRTPYAVTAWLRQGIAPLVAAVQWERRHLPEETPPITRVDAEAAFLLSLPLLRLPSDLSGSCRMGIELSSNGERRLIGAMAYLDQGRVASCSVRLQGNADAWATGSTNAWLRALTAAEIDSLQRGGDQRLARAVLDGLHRSLFDPGPSSELDTLKLG